MNNPLFNLLQDTIIVPGYKIYKNFFTKPSIRKNCNRISDYIFKYSKETSLIMLLFNAVSIMSSHSAQIRGLKKSDRENKDYLIKQEKKERWLDLGLTIAPPFMINNYLKKKLGTGEWATKESMTKLKDLVGPVVGASREDLYQIDTTTTKETICKMTSRGINGILKKFDQISENKNAQKPVKDFLEKQNANIKNKLKNYALRFPVADTEIIATDFDDMVRKGRVSEKLRSQLRNGRAYDELCGEVNGILIMATLGYTVLASSVITPIFKNIMANRAYEKELKKMGETKESIKRKGRFSYNKTPIKYDDTGTFDTFSDTGGIFNMEKQKKPEQSNSIFNTFNTYNKIASQSSRLRI